MTAIEPGQVLRSPNAIGPADFDGWVQKRGIYFAKRGDARYPLNLRGANPSEASVEGSLLVAPSTGWCCWARCPHRSL